MIRYCCCQCGCRRFCVAIVDSPCSCVLYWALFLCSFCFCTFAFLYFSFCLVGDILCSVIWPVVYVIFHYIRLVSKNLLVMFSLALKSFRHFECWLSIHERVLRVRLCICVLYLGDGNKRCSYGIAITFHCFKIWFASATENIACHRNVAWAVQEHAQIK